MWDRIFNEHPASVGESYGEHFGVAMSFSWALLLASMACFIHAILPCFFKKSASKMVTGLHDRMVTHRDRRPSRDAASEQIAAE
jgi:hypothetical protein